MDAIATLDDLAASPEGAAVAGYHDAELVLTAASEKVRRYCGWHVCPVVTETVTLDGPGGGLLKLPTLHMTGVTSVVEDGVSLDVSGLEWSENGLIRKDRWTRKFRGVTVTFTHGFDSAAVKSIVCRLAIGALSSPMGVKSESAGGQSVSYESALGAFSSDDLLTLAFYRLEK